MSLFDPVRNCYVADLPEERVRQKLLRQMIESLGFPKSLIAIEQKIGSRRADIICFAKNIKSGFTLYPLLMIECKAVLFNQKTIDQVLGYNHSVRAFFVAIANFRQIRTFWFDQFEKKYKSVDFLPNYNQLIKTCVK